MHSNAVIVWDELASWLAEAAHDHNRQVELSDQNSRGGYFTLTGPSVARLRKSDTGRRVYTIELGIIHWRAGEISSESLAVIELLIKPFVVGSAPQTKVLWRWLSPLVQEVLDYGITSARASFGALWKDRALPARTSIPASHLEQNSASPLNIVSINRNVQALAKGRKERSDALSVELRREIAEGDIERERRNKAGIDYVPRKAYAEGYAISESTVRKCRKELEAGLLDPPVEEDGIA